MQEYGKGPACPPGHVLTHAEREMERKLQLYREEVAERLRDCLRLQADIAALPAAGENRRQTLEMERLCKELDKAALSLGDKARRYMHKAEQAEAQCPERAFREHGASEPAQCNLKEWMV